MVIASAVGKCCSRNVVLIQLGNVLCGWCSTSSGHQGSAGAAESGRGIGPLAAADADPSDLAMG